MHGDQPVRTLSPARKRTVRNGSPSNDLVLSATAGSNETLFPQVLDLYVAKGSAVADVTYGKGVFWRNNSAGAGGRWRALLEPVVRLEALSFP